jgi:histone H3/H4
MLCTSISTLDDARKCSIRAGVTTLQWCYNGIIRVLQECYKSVARVLQECYKSVTRVLQECCKSVARVLQECCKSFARVLQECYKSVTRVLQECYKSVTRVLQDVRKCSIHAGVTTCQHKHISEQHILPRHTQHHTSASRRNGPYSCYRFTT